MWLARGVTGALRAVKVVWREDFEDERGFEREFEGILKFEPMSRDHPALMNILHVGRSPDGSSFYYYVMELGDDLVAGRDINPIEYEPRTLRADHHQASGVMWDTNECIEVGLRLAEALHHLHERGLAHRDVKPSNVIFVNGKAKLADIGLVAARGQRTFVGTEGFVPPEGPGSAQADVYSLGKVLYEIATGKDRMNFPELPDDMPTGADRKRWLELNRIICDVCEPRISKRKISTAADLAEALRRIQRGKRRRQSGLAVMLTTLLLTGFACWAGWEAVKNTEWAKSLSFVPQPPPPSVGLLRVFSTPEGADVYSGGVIVGTTPTPTMTANVGEEVTFMLRKSGFKPLEVKGTMTLAAVNGEAMTLYGEMQVFSPPQNGDPWVDHLNDLYQPVEDHHVGSGFVTKNSWNRAAAELKLQKEQFEIIRSTNNGQPVDIVLAHPKTTQAYCAWLRTSGIKAGFLTEDHEVTALREVAFSEPAMSERARKEDLRPFRVMIRHIIYGKIQLTSTPPGAEVYVNGQAVGHAHGLMLIPNVKPGEVDLLLVLEGYKPVARRLKLKEGQTLEENINLVKNEGVVFGRDWENGIGMKFAPVGQDLMASIWETRVSDYALFTKETGRPAARPAFFEQNADHPVVNVSREDAMAFCEWLNLRERKAERISKSHIYRLPTDVEWSLLAGLVEEDIVSPGWRDARKQRVFPWGADWPDGEKVGNFADMAAARTPGVESDRTIAGYDDGFAFTAPVGSFPPNALG
ncbi:MAG: SUMF1/EgtB/PvdO family nonheme iron enzyme, partial [Akkermansiaceae bacterium]|nr:SUMF1/EgtB/PvdO family nonheme iron enzyme [Akkermansiaceae bacterium]